MTVVVALAPPRAIGLSAGHLDETAHNGTANNRHGSTQATNALLHFNLQRLWQGTHTHTHTVNSKLQANTARGIRVRSRTATKCHCFVLNRAFFVAYFNALSAPEHNRDDDHGTYRQLKLRTLQQQLVQETQVSDCRVKLAW